MGLIIIVTSKDSRPELGHIECKKDAEIHYI